MAAVDVIKSNWDMNVKARKYTSQYIQMIRQEEKCEMRARMVVIDLPISTRERVGVPPLLLCEFDESSSIGTLSSVIMIASGILSSASRHPLASCRRHLKWMQFP